MHFINKWHKQLRLDGWRVEGTLLESRHCKSAFFVLPGASLLRSVGSQVLIYHLSGIEMWIHNKSKANLGMIFSNINCANLQKGRVRIRVLITVFFFYIKTHSLTVESFTRS